MRSDTAWSRWAARGRASSGAPIPSTGMSAPCVLASNHPAHPVGGPSSCWELFCFSRSLRGLREASLERVIGGVHARRRLAVVAAKRRSRSGGGALAASYPQDPQRRGEECDWSRRTRAPACRRAGKNRASWALSVQRARVRLRALPRGRAHARPPTRAGNGGAAAERALLSAVRRDQGTACYLV
jgi:hypothetical protein